jgi:hypothetical protein
VEAVVTDLMAWLRQQIDEDERVALAVKPLGVTVDMGGNELPHTFLHSRGTYASEDGYPRRESDPAAAAHFARHDPARVLAEVAAKRALLDGCEETLAGGDSWDPQTDGGCSEEFELARFVIRQLAQPFAGRPGWREEWAT